MQYDTPNTIHSVDAILSVVCLMGRTFSCESISLWVRGLILCAEAILGRIYNCACGEDGCRSVTKLFYKYFDSHENQSKVVTNHERKRKGNKVFCGRCRKFIQPI